MTWHKFETAPKDGSLFYAKVKNYPFLVQAKYFKKHRAFKIKLAGKKLFISIKQSDLISWTGERK